MRSIAIQLRTSARAAFAAFILCTAVVRADNASGAATEYEIKAAVLYKVAKFITWPEREFQSKGEHFVVCIVGSNEIVRAFSSLEQKLLQGRPLAVRRVSGDTLDLRQCHAVFFARTDGQDVDYSLQGLAESPILTLGETAQFTRHGGMLALVTDAGKIQFTINLAASKRAGLGISSQLLHLATVEGAGP